MCDGGVSVWLRGGRSCMRPRGFGVGIRVKTLSALDCHHHLIHTVFQADAKPTLNSIKISKAVHHPGSNQLSFKYLNLKISD